MLNKETAAALVKKICSYTNYYATVVIESNEQGVTRFANSGINQNVSIADAIIKLTLHDGKKETTCSSNVMTDEGLKKLVRDAESILPFVPDGEYELFPVSDEPTGVREYCTAASSYDVSARAALIRQGMDILKKDYSAAGALILDKNVFAYGNSTGQFRFAAFDEIKFNTVITHANGAAGSADFYTYEFDSDSDTNIQEIGRAHV